MRVIEDMKLTDASKIYSLRKILFEDFKSIGRELPINGGWGYEIDDPIIIDKNDPAVIQGSPFDGVGIEYKIVQTRIYEELIIFRSEGEKFNNIEWKLRKQRLLQRNERMIDYLVFKGTCLHDKDYGMLKKEYEDNLFNPDFDEDEHDKKRESLLYHFETEYFFDITSFFAI
jgi:hypothetical protein